MQVIWQLGKGDLYISEDFFGIVFPSFTRVRVLKFLTILLYISL